MGYNTSIFGVFVKRYMSFDINCYYFVSCVFWYKKAMMFMAYDGLKTAVVG